MADTNMVPFPSGIVDRPPETYAVVTNDRVINSPSRQNPQHEGKIKADGLSLIRGHYEKQGFPKHITNVLLASWRPSTQKQYAVYINKWSLFCREREIAPHSPALKDILEFLYAQQHLSYSALNCARSALSCFINLDQVPVGQHPTVCRFLKGVFEKRPPSAKYYGIWDVSRC